MNRIEEIISKLGEVMPILEEKYKVQSLQIFGSYVRGEQGKDSDLDILVEFHEVIDLFEFLELEEYLSEVLSVKVDLVMKETLKPSIKDKILAEAVPV